MWGAGGGGGGEDGMCDKAPTGEGPGTETNRGGGVLSV